MIQEQLVHQLKLQLSSMQTRRKEDREQLSEKSYHLASNKSELSRMQQQNVLMSKQVNSYLNLLTFYYQWILYIKHFYLHGT